MNNELIEKAKENVLQEPKPDRYDQLLWVAIKAKDTQTTEWGREQLVTNVEKGIITDYAWAADWVKKSLLFGAKQLRLKSYMEFVEWDREPQKKFWEPRKGSKLELVADDVQDLIDDKLDVLVTCLPPGTGKTTLANFVLSMLIGKFPDKPSLATGHSGTLTQSIYDGIQQITTDPEYKWGEVYRGTRIITNAKEQTIDADKKHRFSSFTGRAIGASLTGATRAELILVVDDLVTGLEEALSVQRLDKKWDEFRSDALSRMKMGCKLWVIGTPWSVHDHISRLERMYDGNNRFRLRRIPALNDDGQSNFNYRYGVGFDTEHFLKVKETQDEATWNALYMCEPIERENLIFNSDDLRYFYEVPDDIETVIACVDTAEGGGDDTVMLVAGLRGNDCYILDCVCDDGLPEVTDTLCAEMLLKYKVKQCQFESNSAGGRTADKVQEIVKSKGGRTNITKKRTTANKQTKIIVNSDYVKRNFLFKDKKTRTHNDPYSKMVKLLCGYTAKGGKKQRDDVPDCAAQLSEYIQTLQGNTIRIFDRFF